MENYQEIHGDLIVLAKQGKFDAIAHGCNCFCTMGAGIAPQMAAAFGCDSFEKEKVTYLDYDDDGHEYEVQTNNRGDINKLGTINYEHQYLWFKHPLAKDGLAVPMGHKSVGHADVQDIFIVNAYTQYHYGLNHRDGVAKPFDYEAFTMRMRKMNHIFKGKHIGLPQIGAGLAGGDWQKIKQIIKNELKNCIVTVVIYKK
jgi:O-acetyl-ADP-ribose deacetylase (regulator of RNase III)